MTKVNDELVDVEEERKLFEAEAQRTPECCDFGYSRNANGTYADGATDAAWLIWLAARSTQAEGAKDAHWLDLNRMMPKPEVFVLTWDGKKVGIDWWGSLRHRGDGVTHWMPFPKPPGAGDMYGMHSIAATQKGE